MNTIIKDAEGVNYIVNPEYLKSLTSDFDAAAEQKDSASDSDVDDLTDGPTGIITLLRYMHLAGLASSFVEALNHSLQNHELTEAEGNEVCQIFNTKGGEAALDWIETKHPELLDTAQQDDTQQESLAESD